MDKVWKYNHDAKDGRFCCGVCGYKTNLFLKVCPGCANQLEMQIDPSKMLLVPDTKEEHNALFNTEAEFDMYCPVCGKGLTEGDKLDMECPLCGASLILDGQI